MFTGCDQGGSSAAGPACTSRADGGANEFEPIAPAELARALGRGVNFGNMFDAPNNGDWDSRYQPGYVPLVKDAGFSHIRLPVRWSNHAAVTADATLDESFACVIDNIIDEAVGLGLFVVMDLHHYRQLDGDPLDPREMAVAESVVDQRFVNIWRQLARRYQQRSNHLVFELYNEPHNRLSADGWNQLMPQALEAVRESNPERIVALGGPEYDNANRLFELALPADRNLIITFHDYDPFDFAFQGSYIAGSDAWVGTTCCSPDQQELIRSSLDTAVGFGTQLGYPVYLGEFGTSPAGDLVSRQTYLHFVRSEAEARNIPWALWSLVNMGIYDATRGAWRDELKNALLGP